MTGGPFEAAAAKYGPPVAKESWRQGRRLYQRLQPDHGPIGQCPNLQRFQGDRVVMMVGVAPTRSAKRVSTSAFVRAAQQVGEEVFVGLVPTTDFSGTDRVRLIHDRSDPVSTPQHILEFYPSGFMFLQWGLDVVGGPAGIGPFPISEFIRVLRRVHSVVQLPAYQQLHGRRIGEKRRRLDWRGGGAGFLSTPHRPVIVGEVGTPPAGEVKPGRRPDLVFPPGRFPPGELTRFMLTPPY